MILKHIIVLSADLFSICVYGLIMSQNMVRAHMCQPYYNNRYTNNENDPSLTILTNA